MKLLLKVLGGLAVLVLLLVVVAFFFPRTYRVERSVVIAAPAEVVFPLVADLREWRRWGVWYELDPAMRVTYSTSPAPNEVGGWTAWTSESQGNGRALLLQVHAPAHVRYRLEFPDMDMSSFGDFVLMPVLDGVQVTWSDAGDLGLNPLARWFGLFLDGMIGPSFEGGLSKLKRLAEEAAAEAGP